MAAGSAAVALRALPSLQLVHRYTVMAATFIPYGLVAFAGAAVIFATTPRSWVRPVALAAVAGLVLQGWWARPYWPAAAPAAGTGSLKLLTMNMRCNPGGIPDLAALTARVRPDVVVVEGLQQGELELLGTGWARLLPHSAFHSMLPTAGCGTFVFSRTPLRDLSGAGDVQPVVEVDRPEGAFTLLPVDFPTPSRGLAPWLAAFTQLSKAAAAHQGHPLVAAGDFNATREHVPMRRLLQTSGLRDAAEAAGSGWQPTFPSQPWHPPLVGLDHALISAGLHASDVRTESIAGQEHRALLVVIR